MNVTKNQPSPPPSWIAGKRDQRRALSVCEKQHPDGELSLPVVSVVMITYNGGRYILAQLNSILTQTCSDLEVIISDDGSTDGSFKVLTEVDDPRVRVYRNTGVRGVHGNLENALRYVRGDFIAIADQDDVWEPTKIERMLASIGDHSAIYCDSSLIDANDNVIHASLIEQLRVVDPDIGINIFKLLKSNSVSGHALLFRRELLQWAIPFNQRPVYDQQIAMLASLRQGMKFLNAPLVRHRIHGANAQNSQLIAERVRDAKGDKVHRQVKHRQERQILAQNFDFLTEKIDVTGGAERLGLIVRLKLFALRVVVNMVERVDTHNERRRLSPLELLAFFLIYRDITGLTGRQRFRRALRRFLK